MVPLAGLSSLLMAPDMGGLLMRLPCYGLFLVAPLVLTAPLCGGDDFKLESGFTLLFNGKNLDGWKTKKEGESLDGKTEAYKGRFQVKDGKLIIDPKVKGDLIIETGRTFAKDVHIKFEFLPGPGCNNDLFLRGQKFDIVKKLKHIKEGEWNTLDIIVEGDKIEYKCNGQTERTGKVKGGGTPFGIRAEFGPIEIRRLRFKEGA